MIATTLTASEAPKAVAAHFDVHPIALPGAPDDGVMLDYLAVDRARHRVWVPAGGTGNAIVIDTKSQKVDRIEKFPTAEVERRGKKRLVGLSSATIGDGFVYVGNRADLSVCAVDAATLERGGCVTLPSSPDGVAFVARKKEVWVTMPRVQSIQILDVATPTAPKLAGTIKLDGDPEGYAVDDAHGLFYTNLEDKDKTLRIDVSTHQVTATWTPSCGEDGPRGLALEPAGQFLMVACTQHVAVLAAGSFTGNVVNQGSLSTANAPGSPVFAARPPARTGEDCAKGIAVFQTTFFEGENSTGYPAEESTPEPLGPRNCVH